MLSYFTKSSKLRRTSRSLANSFNHVQFNFNHILPYYGVLGLSTRIGVITLKDIHRIFQTYFQTQAAISLACLVGIMVAYRIQSKATDSSTN